MPEYVKEAPLRLEVGLIEYRLQTDSRGNSPPLSHETESASTENVGSASSSAPKTVMSMTPARKRTRSEVESLPFAPPKKVAKKTSMAMNK